MKEKLTCDKCPYNGSCNKIIDATDNDPYCDGMRCIENELGDFTGKEILEYVANHFSILHVLRYFEAEGKIKITNE